MGAKLDLSFSRLQNFIFLFLFLVSTSLFSVDETKKKTVCLNMIVKNEKEVIKRCLESVLPIIDTWVIVDTGSTDGTQKVIKEYLKNIPGKLYERPWVNFGHNRQEALELAKSQADYILFMDADDKLEFDANFDLPKLSADFYAIASYNGGIEYWIPRLIKANLDWFWDGVVHEDLNCKETLSGLPLTGAKYVYIHDGARAKDPLKAQKDAELLEAEIKIRPKNPRNYFYLARSYESANQPAKALKWYQERIKMEGNPEEVFNSMIRIGHIQNALKFDSKTVEESFFNAYLNRPHRAEPLYYLACKISDRGDFEKAYQILNTALELPSNPNEYMCLEKWIYDYGLIIQSIICAKETGRYFKGIEFCEQLLKRNDLPENVRKLVEEHFEAIHQINVKEAQKKITNIMKENVFASQSSIKMEK